MARINKLVRGQHPTLLEASKGNELIDAINILSNMQIGYGDAFRVDVGNIGVNITIPNPPDPSAPTAPPTGGDYQVGIDKTDYAEEEISFVTPTDGSNGNNTRPFWLSADEVGFESLQLNGFWAQKTEIKNEHKSIYVNPVGTGGDGLAEIQIDSILVNGFGGGELELKSTDASVKIDNDKLPSAVGDSWISGYINLHALTINSRGGKIDYRFKSAKDGRVKVTEYGSGENFWYEFDGLSLMGINNTDAQIKSTKTDILGVSTSGDSVVLDPTEMQLTSATPNWLSVTKTGPNAFSISFLPPSIHTITGCDGSVQVYKAKS